MKKTVIAICASLLSLSGYVHGGTAATLKGGGKRLGNSNIRDFASPARQNKTSATSESSTLSDTSQKLKFGGSRQKTIDGVEYTYRGYLLDRIGGHLIDWSKRPFVLAIEKAEFDPSTEKIKIPDEIDGIPVLRIGAKCFQNCSRIKSVVLPKKILTIYESAFEGCRALESVSGLEQCRAIGYYAFKNCKKLKTRIAFEKEVYVKAGAFEGCHEIESVEFHERINPCEADYEPDKYAYDGYSNYIDSNTFADCRKLSHFKFPVGVRDVHAGAFAGCLSLADVVIPDSVEQIWGAGTGDLGVFEGCTSLRNVTIPSNVKRVGCNAFKGCSSLKKVALPFSLEEVEHEVFEGCTSLESVKIPSAVKSIGGSAFKNCSALTKITIPRNVTEIGVGAFEGCSSLNIALPAKVEKVLPSAFKGCAAMEELKLPNATEISGNAFAGCVGLKTLEIPKMKTIGPRAFKGCKSLRTITIPDGCICWDGCFDDCEGLKAVDIPTSVSFGKTFNGCTNVASFNLRGTLVSVDDRCFAGLVNLKEFSVPDGVTTIGQFAFSNCTGLVNIALPETIKSISDGAFYNCSSLSRVVIPGGVESISARAFCRCVNLKEIVLPKRALNYGQNLFEGCQSLENMPAFLAKRVSDGMFKNCFGLVSVSIPGDVTSIGVRAFEGCSSLSSVSFPDSIERLERESFKDCVKLTSVSIPKEVKECRHAFDGCVNLRKLTVWPQTKTIRDVVPTPENVEEIVLEGEWKGIPSCMFEGCSNIVSISIPEGVTRLGNRAFAGCVRLKAIKVPNGVVELGFDVFKGCSGLSSVELPKTLTRIGSDAFMGCRSLTSISLPDGVRHLESKTFACCVNLKAIKKSDKTLFEDDTFEGCSQLPDADKLDPRKRDALKYEKEQKIRDEEMARAQRKMRLGIEGVGRRVREIDRKAKKSGSAGSWFVLLLVGGAGGFVYVHSRKYKCSYAESLKELVAMTLSAINRVVNALKERMEKE